MREVLDRGDLARGVALEREQQVVAAHAGAVVRDADQSLPGALEVDGDLAGAASMPFSISSLSAAAGRSTTSPAATRFTVSSERMRMRLGGTAGDSS